MNYSLPLNSSYNPYGRTYNQQYFLINRAIPHIPETEKRATINSLTPMSIKDIDDEIRNLNNQYKIKSSKDLNIGNRIKTFGIENKFTQKNIINKNGSTQFYSSSQPKFEKSTEEYQINLPIQLASIDYLKRPINYSSSTIKNSKNVSSKEFQNVNVSLEDNFMIKRLRNEESQIQKIDQKLNIFDEIRPNKLDIKTQPNLYLNTCKQSQFILDLKTDSETPFKKSPVTTQHQEIIKTTKPISQFMKIYESPSKLSHKVNDLRPNLLQKINKRQQSLRTKEIILPKISQQLHFGEGSSYIETINERNRIIVNLQNKITKLQNVIEQKQQLLQKYKSEIKNVKQTYKTSIENFNQLINKLKKELQLTQMKKYNTNINIQAKFRKINQQNQQISVSNNDLQRDIINLKKQLEKKKQSQQVYQATFIKLKTIITEKSNQIIGLQRDLDRISQQNNKMRKRIDQILAQQTIAKPIIIEEDKNQVFNSIMKMNQQQNTKYKNNIVVKEEQIHRLQELNRQFRAVNDSLRNQIQIEKLKRMTQIKNLQTIFKIEEQVKINQINSLNKTLQCIQDKLKYITQQDKRKDEFMLQYLKNRAQLPEDKINIEEFFKKFQLMSVNTNIVQCLKREQTEIETLKTQIRKLILRK